jgi:hypothetical protein
MAQNHVPESVIISQIRSSQTNFVLTTAEIIRLTKGGVTEAVIHAMRDPKSVSAAAPVAPVAPVVVTRSAPVFNGVPIEMTLRDDVPADCRPGDTLHFLVSKDVASGDTVVVAKGAPVTGVVVVAAKKKFLVHAMRATYRLVEVTAIDGTALKVRATPAHLADARKGTPLEEAPVPAGSHFIGYFDGDQSVTVRK